MAIKIGLDAGHGLRTAGKQTPTGIKEWTLNDKVCDKITEMLKDYDCEIIRTDHNEGNIDEPLSQRLNEYLKAGVKCLVSIHHNAYTGTWNSATGFDVFTDRNFTMADERLAQIVHSKLKKYVKLRDRGIKRANFYIINQNKIPAILVEGGFMDGTNDYKVITSDEGQTNYARAVAEGLIEFCDLKKKSNNTTAPTPTPTPSNKIDVIYQVHDDIKNKWLNNITNADENKGNMGYGGIFGHPIDAIKINLSKGNIYYRAHSKTKGKWLGLIKNRTDYAGIFNQPIDGITMYTDTGKTIVYQVHTKGGKWLGKISGYDINDAKKGYAGILGKEIDAIRIYIV